MLHAGFPKLFCGRTFIWLDSQSFLPQKKRTSKFKTLVNVLSVDNKTIDLAIASDFHDFEDAIQYYTAIENGLTILVTRNIKDYKKTTIIVVTPETYLTKP